MLVAIAIGEVARVASASPWWGTPVIAGGFTLFGALLSQLGSHLTERRKAAREDVQQRDKDAREICAAFCRAVAASYDSILRERRMEDVWHPRDDEQIKDLWTELQLVAPVVVVTAAREYLDDYSRVHVAYDPRKPDTNVYLGRYQGARKDFMDAVRRQYKLDRLPDLSIPIDEPGPSSVR